MYGHMKMMKRSRITKATHIERKPRGIVEQEIDEKSVETRRLKQSHNGETVVKRRWKGLC